MAEAAVTRPVRTATKPVARRASKPSAAPVIFLTVLFAVLIHVLLSASVGAFSIESHWETFGLNAEVFFSKAQIEEHAPYFVNAPLAFFPFDLFFGFCFAVLMGFALRVPFFRDRVYHTIIDVKKRLMLQLSATQEEVESILRNDPENNQRLLARREDINLESVQSEIEHINKGQAYLDGRGSFMSGIATYMKFHFAEHYANTVQGLAYAGAAFLIIMIGIRGLKFIPAEQPSPILMALGVEFSLLSLLALSLLYTEEEERTDRILKQMVDAVKGGRGRKAVAEMEESLLSRGDYEKIIMDQVDKKMLEVLKEKDGDALKRLALDLISKST
jgi:hypothetical protein